MRDLKALALGLFITVASFTAAAAQCGTQAPANKFCGNDTGSPALATYKSIPAGALTPIVGGTVLGNPTGGNAVPIATIAPVLGIPGSSQGQIGFAGATGGTAILRGQSTAGSAINLLPTSAGTLVSTSSGPLVINAVTGQITCPTCVTSSGGGAITGTAPISVSASGVVSINAPYVTLTASNGGIVYSGATNLAILAGTATARQMLQSGASTTPAWSTATWPATTIAGGLLVSTSANTVTASATPVLGVPTSLQGTLGFAGVTSGTATITAQAAAGTPIITLPTASGTVAVSATSPLALSATTGALTCPTCVTSSGGGAITGTVPVAVSAGGVVSITGLAGGVLAGASPAFTTTPTLGASGTLGTITFGNATSGTITLAPATGALGAVTATLPANTGTIAELNFAQTWTALQTHNNSTIKLLGSSTGGTTFASANSGASNFTLTFPAITSTVSTTIASGAKALATGAIGSAACTAAQTDTATGTLTTDPIIAAFNGDPSAVTGYVPLITGMLTILVYPTADTVNFKVCNNTASSITPGAITINWRVVR